MLKRMVGYFTLPLLLLLAIPPRDGRALTPPEGFAPGPDVIMGNLPTLFQAGSNGTQVGLMMGTDICNNGNVQVNWFRLPETDHPVIPQNLYRMSGGANNDERFEQIGQSWAMHQFFPLQNNACLFGCTSSPDSAHLGVGCSTADSAGINASQSVVGSRAWVNPFTGIFPATANTHSGHTHDGTMHRILVEGNDLNTAMNPGATYYGEAQLVTPHEYAWCQSHPGQCNMFNNVSYRKFMVTGTTSFTFAPVGATVQMTPAVFAWPGATIQTIEPEPGVDGRAFIAYKVTCQGTLPITCEYEYAIYNQNLDRGIQSFSVPGGCGMGTPTNLEFHAPLNHPGIADDGTVGNAGYSNVSWTAQTGAAATWSAQTFAQNPNANALRWGTLYNFRFQAGTGPTTVNATIGFFKTGAPITVPVLGPSHECQPSPSPSVTPPPTPTATPSPSPTPTPGACGWSFATPLPGPILAEAVTSLGGHLYTFGGSSNSFHFATSLKFNGTAWTTIAPLPVALSGAAAVTDGTSIYILGGADSSGTALNTLYKYDPVANNYTTLMPFGTASSFHAAVYLNGKIYKFGGATNALEIYNIATNQWTIGTNYPLSVSYIGGFAHGNFIYGAGGFVLSPPAPTAKTFGYDPISNTWNDAAIADLPATVQGAAAVSSSGGGILAGGRVGGTISTSVISWEQTTNVWSSLPSMLAARSNMNGAVLNGSLYVVGGGSVAFPGGTKDVQRLGCGPAPSPTPTATATASPSSTIIIDPGTPTPTATATAAPTPTPTPPCGPLLGENFDNVIPPALPPGWSSTSWVTSTTDPDTVPNCAFVDAPAFLSDRDLRSIRIRPLIPLASISFRNNYDLESSGGEFFDGAVLEISSPNINGGAFTDITNPTAGGSFLSGGYNGKISSDFGSPIAGREAWSGNSGGYIDTAVYFGANVTGQTIELRFRMVSDLGGSSTAGWRIDTIVFDGVCQILTPTPTATATATPPSTPTPSPTTTPTPTINPTPTTTPTSTTTPTPTPTATPTPTPCGWSFGPPVPIPLYFEAVTAVGSNLFSFGGQTSSGQIANSYKFDGTAWTMIAPLPVPLYFAAAVSDGTYAYILGGADGSGESTRNVYRYDPVTNTYATLAPFLQKVQSSTAVYLGGKIYKFCGYAESKLSTNVLEIYNIATNTWTFGASGPIFGQDVAGFTDGDFIYAAGGLVLQPIVLSTRKTHRYDPATNTWNDGAIADLPVAREKAVGAFFNGGGVVAGGYSNGSTPLASVLRWNPASNTWSDLPDMLAGRADMGGAVLNGSFYIVGGHFGTATNDLQKFSCPPGPTPGPAPQPLNLSTRMRVLTADGAGIGGFIIAGSAPKHVLIRAIGPSLTAFGVPDALADPVLELHGPAGFPTFTNDNWRDTQEAAILATGIAPTNNLESGIDATLYPGAYTGVVRGKNNTSGVALVEVYDLSQGANFRLANISTRASVSTGDNIVIAGFVLGGNPGVDRIVARGLGPSMSAFGVPNPVTDPTLELRDQNGALLIANNDWQENPNQAGEISAANLAPSQPLEAALVATLPPGLYTALLAGRNNGTGLGLVEVYDLGPP